MVRLRERGVGRQLDRGEAFYLILPDALAAVELEVEIVKDRFGHGYLTTIVVAVALVRA